MVIVGSGLVLSMLGKGSMEKLRFLIIRLRIVCRLVWARQEEMGRGWRGLLGMSGILGFGIIGKIRDFFRFGIKMIVKLQNGLLSSKNDREYSHILTHPYSMHA